MTTTTEPPDPSSSAASPEATTAPQPLGQRLLALLRRFRPQQSDRDAIETILEQPLNHETSDFDADERKMLSNILQLKHRTVEDVLIPRADIIAVDVEAGIDAVIELAAAEGHSRLPVYGDDMDDIRGLVHIKDLLAAKARGSNEGLDAILRAPLMFAVFLTGSLVGISSLSALIHKIQQRAKDELQVVLIGFIFGSLFILWPPNRITNFTQTNSITDTTWAVIWCLVGLIIVFVLDYYERKK